MRALIPGRFDRQQLWSNMYTVGVKSFPIVIFTALFIGAIMVLQTGHFVRRTGTTGLLGWGAGLAVLAEIGPVMIGLMFNGRAGAFNTAELGTMTLTNQVTALRAMAIDPIEFLVVPRFISMMVMLGLLAVVGDLFALIGGALTSQFVLSVHWKVFAQGVIDGMLLDEFVLGLVKCTLFGATISVVSCFYGLRAKGGASGLGQAVNASVVVSAVGVFLMDFLATYLWVSAGWL